MPLITFSGLASGIDVDSLISATSDARRKQRITPWEEKVSELTDTNSAFDELSTKLATLQSKVREFSTINGGGVVKSAASSDETIATAIASNAASNGTYNLTVTQLAKNATFGFKSTAGTYGASSSVISSAINDGEADANRTVTVEVGTGSDMETTDIVLTSTSTLEGFVSEFNAASSKAVASVVNAGTSASPDYRIIIVSNNEGTAKGSVNVSVGSELSTNSAFDSNTTSQALDATFKIAGIGPGDGDTITRSTNSVSDVIPDITFNLADTGAATITVTDDTAATISKVQDMVDAYNEVVAFIAENNLIVRETDGADVTNTFGPLAGTRTDDSALTALRSALSGSGYSEGSEIRIFADLGITTERDGTLSFDSTDLEDAISSEPDSVKQILQNFADTTSLTGGTIDQYIRFNGLLDVAINGNTSLISDLNDRIADGEAAIAKEEESMRARFSRLESLMSRLQSQQQTLTSALAGLG